ncbi:MAG: hypothetical protein M1817_001414 [Caeruleum heppii]|nr:MAG: hypothetical protein M1817_001414 [Caeruleum heppii]
MSDADLEQIRKARLAQLQQQAGGSGAGGGGGGGEGAQEDQRKQQEGQSTDLVTIPLASSDILSSPASTTARKKILLPDAADRLGRIRLVKESRATDIENRLIMLARSGQLRQKVTEDQLKELLGAVNAADKEEKIVVSRRKGGWDDDDDLDDL